MIGSGGSSSSSRGWQWHWREEGASEDNVLRSAGNAVQVRDADLHVVMRNCVMLHVCRFVMMLYISDWQRWQQQQGLAAALEGRTCH
jgi:hypothetical protein